MEKDFPKEAVNIDFHLKEGKMHCSKPWNTQFQLDADNLAVSKSVIEMMSSSEEPSKEEILHFEKWREDLSVSIQSLLGEEFRSHVRSLVFEMNDKELFPMTTIRVVDSEITSRPENDKVLVVRKDAPQGEYTPPVTLELLKEFEESGKDVNEIISDKKKNGDSKYKWVTSASWRKHFYDITISMMIDYSPRNPEITPQN